jgi:hypothetical protein
MACEGNLDCRPAKTTVSMLVADMQDTLACMNCLLWLSGGAGAVAKRWCHNSGAQGDCSVSEQAITTTNIRSQHKHFIDLIGIRQLLATIS